MQFVENILPANPQLEKLISNDKFY